jgi:hypothetical protein
MVMREEMISTRQPTSGTHRGDDCVCARAAAQSSCIIITIIIGPGCGPPAA